MLWGGKENVERRHKGEALEEIEKKLRNEFGGFFTDSTTKSMVSDFESFVNWKRRVNGLPSELNDEIEEYKRIVPAKERRYIRCGGFEGYEEIENYKFD